MPDRFGSDPSRRRCSSGLMEEKSGWTGDGTGYKVPTSCHPNSNTKVAWQQDMLSLRVAGQGPLYKV